MYLVSFTENKKSNHFKRYGYSKFGCCMFARQYKYTIMRIGNMLNVFLFWGKSEPHYAYKRYTYKKRISTIFDPKEIKTVR